MRDAGDVEDGIEIFERVEAGVIAERAFAAKFVEIHVAFEHDLAGGRHFEVDGLALHQIDRRSAEKSGDQVFLDLGRRGNDGRKSHRRIGADGDRDFHLPGRTFALGKNADPPETARHDVDRRRLYLRPRRACARAHVRPPLSGAASASPWCARRRPACGTCRDCACQTSDRAW